MKLNLGIDSFSVFLASPPPVHKINYLFSFFPCSSSCASPFLPQTCVDEENRCSKEVLEVLARSRLVSLPELDMQLSKQLAAGKNLQGPSEMLMHLMKACMLRAEQVGRV